MPSPPWTAADADADADADAEMLLSAQVRADVAAAAAAARLRFPRPSTAPAAIGRRPGARPYWEDAEAWVSAADRQLGQAEAEAAAREGGRAPTEAAGDDGAGRTGPGTGGSSGASIGGGTIAADIEAEASEITIETEASEITIETERSSETTTGIETRETEPSKDIPPWEDGTPPAPPAPAPAPAAISGGGGGASKRPRANWDAAADVKSGKSEASNGASSRDASRADIKISKIKPPEGTKSDVRHESRSPPHILPISTVDGDELWAIDRILARRYNAARRRVEYLIVWKGFEKDPVENTWEPTENLSPPSLVFVRRRWRAGTCPAAGEIEVTDPDLDAERVEEYLEWERTQQKVMKAAARSKKRKAEPKRKSSRTRRADADPASCRTIIKRRLRSIDCESMISTVSSLDEDDWSSANNISEPIASDVESPSMTSRGTRLEKSPRKTSRSATFGKKSFGPDDSSAVANRPTRATRKTLDYSESSSTRRGDDDNSINGMSGITRSTKSGKRDNPKILRRRYRDRGIKGSEVPPCKSDLSTSVVARLTDRKSWLAMVPEMMTVCNEAARRATLDSDPTATRYEQPLSDVYMRERLEYDDMIMGITIRTKPPSVYLQGFIVVTEFQVWRRTFRWATSDEPAAGITQADHRLCFTDMDGSLTEELRNVRTRKGDSREGDEIVFDRVAEISFLGGLRCGGYLVRTALSDLRQSGKFDYVVLQATKIAIPFYQAMGFRRVGAVTRFRDSPGLAEVAYRHWSEIVSGEAQEASYMMAISLTVDPSRTWFSPTIVVSAEDRKAEVIADLRSTFALLSDSINVTGSSTGSRRTYVHTLRELLSTALDFSRSAGDVRMTDIIMRAKNECTTSKIGEAKNIIRRELGLIAPKKSKSNGGRVCEDDNLIGGQGLCLPNGLDGDVPAKDFQVSVRLGDISLSSDFELVASIPEDTNVFSREIRVTVRPDMGVRTSPCANGNDREFLRARLALPRMRRNLAALHAASSIAVQCLRSVLHGASFLRDGERPSSFPPVVPGDYVMIKVISEDNSFMWVTALVKRHCKAHELPEEVAPAAAASILNSFILRTFEDGDTETFSRMLDTTRRGVGRDWCTSTDWYSFQVLPTLVLDALLIGSFVEYPTVTGGRVAGFVEQRTGRGLGEDLPHYRLVSYSEDGDREEVADYPASALKEAVVITDKALVRATSVLEEALPKMPNGAKYLQARTRYHSTFQMDEDAVEEWVQRRVCECDVTSL